MSSITYDDLKALMATLKPLPEVRKSTHLERGVAYRVEQHGKLTFFVNPDDYQLLMNLMTSGVDNEINIEREESRKAFEQGVLRSSRHGVVRTDVS